MSPYFGELEGIDQVPYFRLLEVFEREKGTPGVTMANRRFIEARKELIKRYRKHSEAYKFWLGRVHTQRRQVFDKALQKYFHSAQRGRHRDFQSCVHSGVYEIYSTHVSQQKAPPLDTKRFIQALSNIEGTRSSFYIFPQSDISSRKDRKTTPMSFYLGKFSRYEARLADMFAYHAHPKGAAHKAKLTQKAHSSSAITIDNSRLTLRLVPDKAMEVFEKVATDIVGSADAKWEAVSSTKIMGPAKLPKSVDSMIIYVNSRERNVIEEIVEFLTDNFTASVYFRPGGPMGMFELTQGITYADSPDPKRGRSFGSTRGESIEENMAKLFVEALEDEKKNVFDVVDAMTEYDLHAGSYKYMHGQSLDYTMPAFRRPFSSMAVDPFAHHIA